MRLSCILSAFAFVLLFSIFGLLIIPALILHFISYPFVKYPQDSFQYLASVVYKIFFFLVPKIEVEKKLLQELPSSAIYVSTHQSNLDFPVLGSFLQKYLIMTTLNFTNLPFVQYIVRIAGIRYLDGNNLSTINNLYIEFEKQLEENRNVAFFVEGTRGDGKKLGRFKKGAFRLAMKMNKPIVPIIIDGSVNILPKGNFCFSCTKKEKIRVKMLEPIYPDKFHNESDMLEYTYNIMSESCQK